jgi:hypothetical protein
MKKIYIPVFLLPLLIACGTSSEEKTNPDSETEKPAGQLTKAAWLIGRWESSADGGILSETWQKEDNSTFSAETYFVVAGDTVFEEHVQLKEINGKIVYSPTIPDENNGKPTDFTMTSASANQIIFENPKHDFPQKIRYTLKGDSLIATISGKRAGKIESEVFAMKKK